MSAFQGQSRVIKKVDGKPVFERLGGSQVVGKASPAMRKLKEASANNTNVGRAKQPQRCSECASRGIPCMFTLGGTTRCDFCNDSHRKCSLGQAPRSVADTQPALNDSGLKGDAEMHSRKRMRSDAMDAPNLPSNGGGASTSTLGDHTSAASSSQSTPSASQGSGTAQQRHRWDRLRQARNAYFERLEALDDGIAVGKDMLDELFVLARVWQTHEDLVWPSEFK